MARILIIGVDGSIGAALAQAFAAAGHAVCGTTRRGRSDGPGERIQLDLADPAATEVRLPAADVIIFSAAMARFADCRDRPELTRRVNVTAPAAIARRFSATGSQVVMLSSSAVLDGRSAHAAAEEPRRPQSAYGIQKAEIEAAILALGGSASVLRLTKVITAEMPLFREWIDALARRQSIRAFSDLTISPIRLADVVTAVAAVIADRSGGLYQVSGADDISYSAIGRHFAHRLEAPADLVQAVRAVDCGIPASEVSQFTSLDTERLRALTDWRPPSALGVIDDVFAEHLPAAAAV